MRENLERSVGSIPEGKILELYAGDYLDQFRRVWRPVTSPNPKFGKFNQVQLHLIVANRRITLAYSKTGKCVMIR